MSKESPRDADKAGMEGAMTENEMLRLNRKKIMLHSYEQQLQAARRMARYTVRKRLQEGLDPDDPDPAVARGHFKSKIAQELFDSLMFFPDANPVVDEIRQQLGVALQKQIEFTYPPGGRLCLAVREKGSLRKLTAQEQHEASLLLRRLTSEKVEHSLAENRMGIQLGLNKGLDKKA